MPENPAQCAAFLIQFSRLMEQFETVLTVEKQAEIVVEVLVRKLNRERKAEMPAEAFKLIVQQRTECALRAMCLHYLVSDNEEHMDDMLRSLILMDLAYAIDPTDQSTRRKVQIGYIQAIEAMTNAALTAHNNRGKPNVRPENN